MLLLVEDRCMVCTKHTIGSEIVLDAPDYTPRWRGSSESSVHLDIVLILRQDRHTVYLECTIGSKIILDHPMELLGYVGHVESCFIPFGDSVSLGAWFALDVP
jgi:hypothetical protein